MSQNPIPSIERVPLSEVSFNTETCSAPKRRLKDLSPNERQATIAASNRRTLDELKVAAKLSPEKWNNLLTRVEDVVDCDDKKFRYRVREWITKNVPHNKQPQVRAEIFNSLYALVTNNSVRSQMKTQEAGNGRSSSTLPPGYEHTCPSEYGSDEENPHDREYSSDEESEESETTEEDGDVQGPILPIATFIIRDPTPNVGEAANTNTKKRNDTEKEESQVSSKKRKTSTENNDKTSTIDLDRYAVHKYDVSSIHLDFEESDEVPVYLTCDMVREKIENHLKRKDITIPFFLQCLQNVIHNHDYKKQVTRNALYSFRRKEGYASGNRSAVFYAAYVYFEKLRIKFGEPKSEDRKTMEELWGDKGGFDLKTLPQQKRIKGVAGTKYTCDRFGRSKVNGKFTGEVR